MVVFLSDLFFVLPNNEPLQKVSEHNKSEAHAHSFVVPESFELPLF